MSTLECEPLQFGVYRGVGGKFGAVQFNLQRPHWHNRKTDTRLPNYDAVKNRNDKEDWKPRTGVIFMEITSATAPNVYDWDNKITLALNTDDMAQLLNALTFVGEAKIYHDPDKGKPNEGSRGKTLNLKVIEREKGCLISCSSKDGNKKHSVPLTFEQATQLRVLLNRAISEAFAW